MVRDPTGLRLSGVKVMASLIHLSESQNNPKYLDFLIVRFDENLSPALDYPKDFYISLRLEKTTAQYVLLP
jgi:hypothetical protein